MPSSRTPRKTTVSQAHSKHVKCGIGCNFFCAKQFTVAHLSLTASAFESYYTALEMLKDTVAADPDPAGEYPLTAYILRE